MHPSRPPLRPPPRGEMLIILITKRKFTGCNGRTQPCCTPLLWERGERLIRFN